MMIVQYVFVFLYSFCSFAQDDVLSILGDDKDKKENGITSDSIKDPGVSPFKALFPQRTAEQNIFFDLLSKGEDEKALLQFFEAFAKTKSLETPNVQGLLAYLFIKNKMPVFAVENLFSRTENANMSPLLAESLQGMLPDTSDLWRLARVEWAPQWSKIFSPSIEVQIKARKVFTATEVNQLKDIIKVSAPDTKDRAAIQWQLVLALALSGDNGTSAKLLQNLMSSKYSPVQDDLMNMTAARMLFESGYMDAAIKYYTKISKKSDYWFEAQEEIAWSYIRKGEPQNALAITESLVLDQFQNLVGPETLFVRSLSQLKVCDYPGVLKTLNQFKDRFKPRAQSMVLLAQDANTPAVKSFIEMTKRRRHKLVEVGRIVNQLPHLVTRDESLYQNIVRESALENEMQIAESIYSKSLALGTSKIGFQGEVAELKNMINSRVSSARNATLARFKALASEEVADTKRLLQKLHIVEAEVLQQTISLDKVVKATQNSQTIERQGTTAKSGRDKMVFPFEPEQVWFDEIAHLNVNVTKGCQAVKK